MLKLLCLTKPLNEFVIRISEKLALKKNELQVLKGILSL